VVTISKEAAAVPGCTARLKAGDKLSIFDLLHGMCLPSGNDASHQLAEYFGNLLYDNK
jgi:D-alanyl-D-alanine carboxypeptidase